MPKRYIVITADIIDSKQNPELIHTLNNPIEKLNLLFKNDLAAYFKLYRGDEIQCVLLSSQNLMKIIRIFRYMLKPFNVRIGVGKGEIDNNKEFSSNKLLNTNPWENNGQAFHLARESLNYLNENRIFKKKPRTFLKSDSNDIDLNSTINSLLNMYDLVLESWTKSQWDGVIMYEKHQKLSNAANELHRKYQSVQRAVSKVYWHELVLCEEKINYLVEKL